MSEPIKLDERRIIWDGLGSADIFTKGDYTKQPSSNLPALSHWLETGGWTTLAGWIQSIGSALLAMLVMKPELLGGNKLLAEWLSAFMVVGGPALLGIKAAVTQKPQPGDTVPAATNSVLGDVKKGPA